MNCSIDSTISVVVSVCYLELKNNGVPIGCWSVSCDPYNLDISLALEKFIMSLLLKDDLLQNPLENLLSTSMPSGQLPLHPS